MPCTCACVAAGNELRRITVGTSSVAPPCVWALTVLPDGTIVSGDGDGAVQFWDGVHGTLLSRQQQFAADVLALSASSDGRSVWAAGVDPRVCQQHPCPTCLPACLPTCLPACLLACLPACLPAYSMGQHILLKAKP